MRSEIKMLHPTPQFFFFHFCYCYYLRQRPVHVKDLRPASHFFSIQICTHTYQQAHINTHPEKSALLNFICTEDRTWGNTQIDYISCTQEIYLHIWELILLNMVEYCSILPSFPAWSKSGVNAFKIYCGILKIGFIFIFAFASFYHSKM